MTSQPIQIDPINSPYPVPWGWVMANLSEGKAVHTPRFRYYRSPSLISPDGQYAAYSRIQMQLAPDFTQNRVTSVLFLENLKTGNLQTITPSSPLADHPCMGEVQAGQPGTIAMLLPIAWSETGNQILAREFEALFGSSIASDFAVVWDRRTCQTYTLAPKHIEYSNAVLLGWSQTYPDRILFQAGMMGDADWPLYTVDLRGHTSRAGADRPITFGEIVDSIWAGPQAHAYL